jgi:NADH:ubiquinone oxidoreductase subunit 3 (subunit A)
MIKALLFPPIVFMVLLTAIWVVSIALSKFSYRASSSQEGKKPYACGEDTYDSSAQPDYSAFFPYAYFFTLAHVATLMLTTVTVVDMHIPVLALVYISAVGVGLYILLRK